MVTVLLITMLVLLVVAVGLLIALFRKTAQADPVLLGSRLDAFEKSQEKAERALREELGLTRDEMARAAREQRQEVGDAFKTLGGSVVQRITEVASAQRAQQDALSDMVAGFNKATADRLDSSRSDSVSAAKQLREEVVTTMKAVLDAITTAMNNLAGAQSAQFESFAALLANFSRASNEKLDGSRTDSMAAGKQLREEVVSTLGSISERMASTLKDSSTAQQRHLEIFSGQLEALTRASGEKLDFIRTDAATGSKQLREEVIAALKVVSETTTRTMAELAGIQKAQLDAMGQAIAGLSTSNEAKLEVIRGTVEAKLQSLQVENAKQLDQMRQTVDEKLQGTLEKRLGESFKLVSERLEMVHKGLGEMQSLATGVGDLKKVLTNVKTRGTWGEVQLGALLEQVLTPDQYVTNVATKGGNERVEFAIKLPGQGSEKGEFVWLPIDAKFPVEDYQRLMEAQDRGDAGGVESAGRQLEVRVKGCAKDISEKYLNPPATTDFGILFLPIEGLFAEVIRRPGLADAIQHDNRVVIAGPTTLWSILNSLQMGFRTLAIQKRSSEVWTLLGAVKTEWTKYGDVLEAVQNKLNSASDAIEKAKVRSRAVERKLRGVQELPAAEAAALLPPSKGDGGEVADADSEE